MGNQGTIFLPRAMWMFTASFAVGPYIIINLNIPPLSLGRHLISSPLTPRQNLMPGWAFHRPRTPGIDKQGCRRKWFSQAVSPSVVACWGGAPAAEGPAHLCAGPAVLRLSLRIRFPLQSTQACGFRCWEKASEWNRWLALSRESLPNPRGEAESCRTSALSPSCVGTAVLVQPGVPPEREWVTGSCTRCQPRPGPSAKPAQRWAHREKLSDRFALAACPLPMKGRPYNPPSFFLKIPSSHQ